MKLGKVIVSLCIAATTFALPMMGFAAAPSAYDGQSYASIGYDSNDPDGEINLAVIAKSDVNIGKSMNIQGSVYSNGNIYVDNAGGNKIDGLFISGTEGSLDTSYNGGPTYQCDGYIHVNSKGTRDGINYYSARPEYAGAIEDNNTSFECSYNGFTIPYVSNIAGIVTMSQWGSSKKNDSPQTVSSDTRYTKLTVSGNGLTIDTTNGDVNIVIDSLSMKNGTISVIGEHKANVYVSNVSSLSSASFNYDTSSWPAVAGDLNKLSMFITGDNVSLSATKISGNVMVNSNLLTISGSSELKGDVDTNASQVTVTGGSTGVYGTVCAPNAETTVTGSGTIFGQLHTNTLVINGAGSVMSGKTDSAVTVAESLPTPTVAPTSEPDAEPTSEPEATDAPIAENQAKVVHYNVASNEYSLGVMEVRSHTPAGYGDLHYDVLSEGTYKVTGVQDIPNYADIKKKVQKILNTTDDVFVEREDQIDYKYFGRVDSNGFDTSLTITPYVKPQIEDDVDTMWLAWGDREGKVTDIWMVIE